MSRLRDLAKQGQATKRAKRRGRKPPAPPLPRLAPGLQKAYKAALLELSRHNEAPDGRLIEYVEAEWRLSNYPVKPRACAAIGRIAARAWLNTTRLNRAMEGAK